jgi:hypothetical protein
LRVGVDRHVQLALVLANKGDGTVELFVVHVQPGEMPGVGVIAKADIHRIGALAHRGFERRQVACGADQLHGGSSLKVGKRQKATGASRTTNCSRSTITRPSAQHAAVSMAELCWGAGSRAIAHPRRAPGAHAGTGDDSWA